MEGANHFFQTGFGIAVLIFIFVLIVLWIILPFLIASIQRNTKETLAINKLILTELKKLNHGVEQIESPIPEIYDQPLTQKCPECGFDNSIEMLECAKCGQRLPMP